MKNPINKAKEYIGDKVYAWKYKDNLSLCEDNPVLFELKATGDCVRDFYNISRGKKSVGGKKGLMRALKNDALWTIFDLQTRFQ